MNDETNDDDLDRIAEQALAALRRARRRAERLARMTGTRLVQSEDGKLVFVDPPPDDDVSQP